MWSKKKINSGTIKYVFMFSVVGTPSSLLCMYNVMILKPKKKNQSYKNHSFYKYLKGYLKNKARERGIKNKL